MTTCTNEVLIPSPLFGGRGHQIAQCGAPAATVIHGVDWAQAVCLPCARIIRQEVIDAGSAWAGTDSR